MRQIDHPEGKRVETGAIRFGDDWPGIFIRGDEALALANKLQMATEFYGLPVGVLEATIALLRSCRI